MGPLTFVRTRRHPLLTAVAFAAPLVIGAGLLRHFAGSCHRASQPVASTPPLTIAPLPTITARGPRPAIEPRAVLGRYWFDRLPENERDAVVTQLFLGGGIAIREEGSYWRSTTEYFDLERRGNTLALASLHDGKKSEPTFAIAYCDEKPPFDLCLTLEGGDGGTRKLYGFSYGEDLAKALPKGGAGSARFSRMRPE